MSPGGEALDRLADVARSEMREGEEVTTQAVWDALRRAKKGVGLSTAHQIAEILLARQERKGVLVEVTFLNAEASETSRATLRLSEQEFRDFFVSAASMTLDDSPPSWDLQEEEGGTARINTMFQWVDGLYSTCQSIIKRSTK